MSTCLAGGRVKSQVWYDMTSIFKRPTDLPLFVWGQPDELISRGIFWYLELQDSLLWQHQPPKNNGLILKHLHLHHTKWQRQRPCQLNYWVLVRNAVGIECARWCDCSRKQTEKTSEHWASQQVINTSEWSSQKTPTWKSKQEIVNKL